MYKISSDVGFSVLFFPLEYGFFCARSLSSTSFPHHYLVHISPCVLKEKYRCSKIWSRISAFAVWWVEHVFGICNNFRKRVQRDRRRLRQEDRCTYWIVWSHSKSREYSGSVLTHHWEATQMVKKKRSRRMRRQRRPARKFSWVGGCKTEDTSPFPRSYRLWMMIDLLDNVRPFAGGEAILT